MASPDRSAPGRLSTTGGAGGTVASTRAVSASASDEGPGWLLEVANEADDVSVLGCASADRLARRAGGASPFRGPIAGPGLGVAALGTVEATAVTTAGRTKAAGRGSSGATGDVTTSSTLATTSASAPIAGETTMAAPAVRVVDVLRLRSSRRTTLVDNSEDSERRRQQHGIGWPPRQRRELGQGDRQILGPTRWR